MKREQALDLYFIDARAKLIDLAAFLDRMERSEGKEDFRLAAFYDALAVLSSKETGKAERVLLAFSDPTRDPIAAASGKSAAWPEHTDGNVLDENTDTGYWILDTRAAADVFIQHRSIKYPARVTRRC